MNRYGEPDFKYIWAKIKKEGVNGKSAYQYAVEAGYSGTEQEFAEKLAQAIPESTSDLINDSGFITSSDIASKAEDDEVVHIAGTETVTGEKTFTEPVTIRTGSDTNSLRVISTNSGGYFQVTRKTSSIECTMEIRSGINGGTFGTLTNHPYRLRVNNQDSLIMGTDKSVKLARTPSLTEKSKQVATTEWAITGDDIASICQ